MTQSDAAVETVDAQRHHGTGRPCCPMHGPVGSAQVGQPVPVSVAGKWFVLYDGHEGNDPEVSDHLDGNAFEMLYICGSGDGKHLVRVYRMMDRKPWPGRSYQLTPGKHTAYYHDTVSHAPVTGEMCYPVVEALLRRLWGVPNTTQRPTRKTRKAAARVEAIQEQRRKMVPPAPLAKPLPRTKR